MIGVVLAGGASSRFGGAPKGLARLNGKAMAQHVADTLSNVCAEVAIEAAPGLGYEQLGLPICSADAGLAGKGPVAGMIAGLRYAAALGADLCAFAPCDMPFLTVSHYQTLRARMDDALAAYAISPDGAEPLVSIAMTRILPDMEAALGAGAIARTHVILDRAGAIGVMFRSGEGFANINTPEELRAAEARLP